MHTFTKKMPIVSLFSFLFFALKFGYKIFVSLLVPEMCAFSARFFFCFRSSLCMVHFRWRV